MKPKEFKETKRHNFLNGDCLKDYLRWYKYAYSLKEDIHENGMSVNYMPFNMAYGVYVDFFDEKGIEIDIDIDSKFRYEEPEVGFFICTEHQTFDSYEFTYKTRQEAREQAIIKANEIYNETR